MKRPIAISLALGLLASVSIGTAVSLGASENTGCWDEYNKRGTRFYRTVVPKDLPLEDCTPGPGCFAGYNANGWQNRIYVPHGQPPATACEELPTTTVPTTPETVPTTPAPTTPPTSDGRFETLPVGAALPSDAECAARVRPMTENRPENATQNATAGVSANDVYRRVTGNFTGTTDEILQWAACKWGVDEDLVRAQIIVETNWRQGALGDFSSDPAACSAILPIGDYPPQYPGDRQHDGECPESVGLGQVRWLYHQSAYENDNAVHSSAYNVDYTYAVWRECFEGRFGWLNDVDGRGDYAAGDETGCTGVWFSGRWYTQAARDYIARVNDVRSNRTWEQLDFPPALPLTVSERPTVAPTTAAPTTAAPTTAAPTTAAPTTAAPTTAAPTTAAPTTAAPTTAAPTTAAPTTVAQPPQPSGARFVETFDDASALDRFDLHVYHRNPDIHDFYGFSGGSWTGDHDESCGSPATQRSLRFRGSDSQAQREANSFYTCRNHLMTSMGDVDGYSIAAFSPAQVFDDVNEVTFEVNLTDLGTRQWWKVGVLSTSKCPELDLRCMYSDVGSADLPDTNGSGRLVATWSGSAGYAGRHGMAIGSRKVGNTNPTPNDKATRHPVSLVDNGNGTVTFSVAGETGTANGSFPACPCRVVFYDHNYTPDKSESGYPIGHTWHWDNIVVR